MRHAFLEVFRTERFDHFRIGYGPCFRQRLEKGLEDLTLDDADRARGRGRDHVAGDRLHVVQKILSLQAANEPQPLRLGGIDHARRIKQIERIHRTNEPRQHPGAAMLGDQPALGEGRRQLCSLSHVAEVAEQGETESNAGNRTVDGGEDRFRHSEKVAEFLFEISGVTAVAARAHPPRLPCDDPAQPRHVRTGAEAAARAGQHHGAHGVVFRRLLDSVAHFFVHLTGPGVELVRAIEGDGGNEIVDAVKNIGIDHAFPPIVVLTIAYCGRPVEENGNREGALADYFRLRQICLVARDLARVIADMQAIFGVNLAYQNANVRRYGLENALFPLGLAFVEVVSPVEADAAAGRFLERSGSIGGYLAIFNCSDPERRGCHANAIGVRTAHTIDHDGFHAVQLHPRDCRAAMIEFDRTEGEEDVRGPYHPAGPRWLDAVRTDITKRLAEIVIESPNPGDIGRHWARILEKPFAAGDAGGRI